MLQICFHSYAHSVFLWCLVLWKCSLTTFYLVRLQINRKCWFLCINCFYLHRLLLFPLLLRVCVSLESIFHKYQNISRKKSIERRFVCWVDGKGQINVYEPATFRNGSLSINCFNDMGINFWFGCLVSNEMTFFRFVYGWEYAGYYACLHIRYISSSIFVNNTHIEVSRMEENLFLSTKSEFDTHIKILFQTKKLSSIFCWK